MLICTLTYTRELDREEPLFVAHREFVEGQVEAARLLCSGPRLGARGGVMLLYGEDEDAARELIAGDPLVEAGVASFELSGFKVGLADPASSLAAGEPGVAR